MQLSLYLVMVRAIFLIHEFKKKIFEHMKQHYNENPIHLPCLLLGHKSQMVTSQESQATILLSSLAKRKNLEEDIKD